MPTFIFHIWRVKQQIITSDGLLIGSFAREAPLGFWTITVWKDQTFMKAFRNSDAHLKSMPRLADWCDEASYVHWEQQDATLPNAEQIFERLNNVGTLSKVRFPSAAHTGGAKTGTKPPTLAGAFKPKPIALAPLGSRS